MTDGKNEIDPQVSALLRRADPAPLGLTSRLEVGLRLGLRRHSSVTNTVPSPSTWIAPPSLIIGAR